MFDGLLDGKGDGSFDGSGLAEHRTARSSAVLGNIRWNIRSNIRWNIRRKIRRNRMTGSLAALCDRCGRRRARVGSCTHSLLVHSTLVPGAIDVGLKVGKI